jgi:DNA mismatch repair protein MutL
MSIIRLLPDHIANQIAAGEVIQRPASVVKELVENAIDANATSIKVIIIDAGRTLIHIIDDGNGMNKEDSIRCFDRHATSKINEVGDLFKLQTKGFRGEALASIASIAQVVLKTKGENDTIGHLVEIEASKLKKEGEIVCSKGSSFEIKNLFFNVPARRNFLKSDYVEFGHIEDEFIRISLAHPECKFHLIHNSQEIYILNPSILRKRIVDIFGRNSNEKLVPIEAESDIIKLSGYIGKPESARKTRGEQYLFVNNRYFKDAYFNHAINKSFEGLIPEKSFPSYFIFLDVDPSKIDVNIHPTKTEIKFEEDRFIYAILLSSTKQALGQYNISPTLDFEIETSFDIPSSYRKNDVIEPQIDINPNFNPFQTFPKSTVKQGNSSGIEKQGFGQLSTQENDWENFYAINTSAEAKQQQIELNDEYIHVPHYLIRGNYLLTNCKSGVLVIDIKRATERIQYEKLISTFIKSPINAQMLLFPLLKSLNKQEAIIWKENKSLLEQLGFKGELRDNDLELIAAPDLLKEEQIDVCLSELFELLMHTLIDKGDIAHKVVAIIAKTSARLATVHIQEQAIALVNELFQLKEHVYTNTGLPILKTITIEDIELKFK